MHITESLNHNFMQDLLKRMELTIEQMVADIQAKYEADEKNHMPWSDYDTKMTKLSLISDMFSALEKYTDRSDELIEFSLSGSAKGTLTINCRIRRGDTTYALRTNVIYAGGHNIQRLHYRYLVDTGLPQTGLSSMTKQYEAEIKKLSKGEKLQNEISRYYQRIDATNEKISSREIMTDDEKLRTDASYKYYVMKHEDINRDSHNWTVYGNDKAGFLAYQAEQCAESIKYFDSATESLRRDIRTYLNEINKLTKKLNAL